MLAFESECLPLDSSFRCKFPFDWTYLDFVQDQISKNGVFDDLFLQEKEAVTVLLNAVQAQEEFWQENSRLNWHLNGDRNIAFFFFHKVSKIMHFSNQISLLKTWDLILDKTNDIQHVLQYFTDPFAQSNNSTRSNLIDQCWIHIPGFNYEKSLDNQIDRMMGLSDY